MTFFKRLRREQKLEATKPDEETIAKAQALISQGHAIEDSGNLEEARKIYESAISLAPTYWSGHLNLGNVARIQANHEEAIRCYRLAAELAPGEAKAHLNLGNALMDARRPSEAASSYQRATELKSDWSAGWLGYASAIAPTDPSKAEASLRKAIDLDPINDRAIARLAIHLANSGRTDEAISITDSALEKIPGSYPLLINKATYCAASGDPEGAAAAYRRALEIQPDNWETWSVYLFASNFLPGVSAHDLTQEHNRFGERISRIIPSQPPEKIGAPHRILKIAYLSPDFLSHPVANFVAPVLRHHDRSRVEIHCFQLNRESDAITAQLKSLAQFWHEAFDLTDTQLVQCIRDNGIDILIDLAGHTTGNRLAVLARKPARLQVGWLGYLCTTGLDTMDYRLCDPITDPPGTALGHEKLLHLPSTQWCYEPLRALPEVEQPPCIRNGHLTLGSFNQGNKIHPELLHHWGVLLQRIPNSRIRFVGIRQARLKRSILEAFSERGIAEDRIDVMGHLSTTEYLASFGTVDIALDTHPYSGATTTCDTLIMGVPVVTAMGERGISRSTASILSACGLSDWIAPSLDSLAETILAKTSDVEALVALRKNLRGMLHSSPVMKAPEFTVDLENLFFKAWHSHIQGQHVQYP